MTRHQNRRQFSGMIFWTGFYLPFLLYSALLLIPRIISDLTVSGHPKYPSKYLTNPSSDLSSHWSLVPGEMTPDH
jgi:hypothetical protein